jgi:alpha-mannosidase
MLTDKQIERMLGKLKRFESILEPFIFEKTGEVECAAWQTGEQYHEIPEASLFTPVEKGWHWGGEGAYCWFTAQYTVPGELDGRDIFIRPRIGGYEAMLWVNGVPFGTFCSKIVFTGHGNHYCDLLKKSAAAGEVIDIAVEYYAGHAYKGCMPLEEEPLLDYDYTFNGLEICTKNEEIQEFYFDLVTLNQLAAMLPADSFRKAQAVNATYKMHEVLYYSVQDTDWQTFIAGVRAAKPFMKEVLAGVNAPGAPFAAVIGHSHMDTAWLWHIDETIKKCARTYSNQVSLMEQYPEYKFIQSSACHGDMILTHYPVLFERIKELVAQGRYEPNGAVWVECDCNITSGESMVRQFLWGQRFTRKHFNYTSNCFWLPDTFGYSAAIPQIMKSCGVDYFLTTKIGWNDTNAFPYDTFYWQGLDGTKVFAHFNTTHCYPDAETLTSQLKDGYAGTVRETTVTDKRICAYGFGDGGGGPQFEMIELARRCKDLNGVPKAEHMLVGDAVKLIEDTVVNPNTFTGELYLELHRGTLTNQHTIKRNNRKAELSLRDLEFFTVNEAVKKGEDALSSAVEPLYRLMLINQFHDILPGTCIPKAHIQSNKETTEIIETSAALIADMTGSPDKDCITLTNTLSFERTSPVLIDYTQGYVVDGDYKQQLYTDLDGRLKLIVSGVTIPAFSSVTLQFVRGTVSTLSAFTFCGNCLNTPFAKVDFDERGFITSFIDTRINRELCGEGYPLNTFLVAEDVPKAWDNWDLDADIECKFKDAAQLISREVYSQGEAALVLRSKYKITAKTTITQDMFFFADTAEVRFDTLMDWQDDHRFLKTAFDTSIMQDFARCEVQFGFVKRPTTRNNSLEKAKFEVLNHKYTDLSEARYGVAILNDCKYALSLEGGKMRLSLHKGGNRPDFRGDKGLHRCVYSFLPHNEGFNVNAVIKPAYELNIPPVVSQGEYKTLPLIEVDADNIIVETIKPCEDNERAFIVRMYDAEGAYTRTAVKLFDGAKSIAITNMLEETLEDLPEVTAVNLEFRPFEIKTMKVIY